MAVDRRLPGLLETLHIQAVNIDPQLVDVVTGLLLVQGMEQHALLHRR